MAQRDPRGHRALREALAEFLGASRGINCDAEQIVIVSGVPQALDILARVLLNPGDSVWMEDPGYFGALAAFQNAGLRTIPVPIDGQGLCVDVGKKRAPYAKAFFLTPAHQFPLGVVMPLKRRLEVLAWALRTGAFVIEDGHGSEHSHERRRIPALQSLDLNESVISIGSFSDLLFPSLRIGYMVLPSRLIDSVLAFRFGIDQGATGLEQDTLAEFIRHGHLISHIRRMRKLYADRLATLRSESEKHLKGLLEIGGSQGGQHVVGFLRNGMSSAEAEMAAASHGVEAMALNRCMLEATEPQGLLLGFAAFDRCSIERGVQSLASALVTRRM
jgi:GntR family transcriptional regulator / MocR family aminotransferase